MVGFAAVVLTFTVALILCAGVNLVGWNFRITMAETGGSVLLRRVTVGGSGQFDRVCATVSWTSDKTLDVGVHASIKRACESLCVDCSTAVTKLLANVGRLVKAVFGNRATDLAVFVDFRCDQRRLHR